MPARTGRYCYEFPRPAATVDIVLMAWDGAALRVLLVQRKLDPFAGRWALPGGFVDMREHLMTSAIRELKEETGVHFMRLAQLGSFGDPDRDPRGRTITTVYYGLAPWGLPGRPGDDAAAACWMDLKHLPRLAFDHSRIARAALIRLRRRSAAFPLFLELLPSHFTLGEAHRVAEALLGTVLDKRNFYKKLLRSALLRAAGQQVPILSGRAAQLYMINSARWRALRLQADKNELNE